MPIVIGISFFISYFASSGEVETNPTLDENTKIAITDDAKMFADGNPFKSYEKKEDGIEAIKNGEIDLYYYIPVDFNENKKVEFYHISEGVDLFNSDANILRGILNQNAAGHVSEEDLIILTGSYEIEDNKLTKNGEAENALGKAIIPGMILVIYFMFVALFGNRFLMAVVEEKENRISEMIFTAVSAKHLIVGKIVAMLALGLIQMLTFVVPVILIVLSNQDNQMISMIMGSIEFDFVAIVMNVLLLIASVFLYAGTCVFVGSLVSTARDAASFIGPAIVAMVFPLYFMQLFLAGEPNFIVYFLSYFPLSAPIALMLRSAMGSLGMVEFIIGLVELSVIAVVAIRVAVITFQKNAINFSIVKPKFLKRK